MAKSAKAAKAAEDGTATEAATGTATATEPTPKKAPTANGFPRTSEGISELRPIGDGTATEIPLVNAGGEYPKAAKKK